MRERPRHLLLFRHQVFLPPRRPKGKRRHPWTEPSRREESALLFLAILTWKLW